VNCQKGNERLLRCRALLELLRLREHRHAERFSEYTLPTPMGDDVAVRRNLSRILCLSSHGGTGVAFAGVEATFTVLTSILRYCTSVTYSVSRAENEELRAKPTNIQLPTMRCPRSKNRNQ
jgi:hypothetical protein